MAISLQQAPTTVNGGSSTVVTLTIPNVPVAIGAGDRLIVVCVHLEGNAAGTEPIISTVTKNGVGFTKLDHMVAARWSRTEIWYLKNPDAGTHNIIVTKSVAIGGHGAGAYVFDGVDQTTTFRTVAKSGGSAALVTNTVPSVVSGDYVLDALTIDSPNHNVQPGANQTESWDFSMSGCNAVSDTQAGADGGVMSHTWTTSGDFTHMAIALIPSVPAVEVSQIRPDADTVATGWTTAPLYSKINDSSDSTVIQATAV
jgi:hypothetical protein